MRIRTLKPEFWSHPVTGRLPGDVQAVAIALLNYADDEGYMVGDVAAIKSAIRPFDDESTNVRRCVVELSRLGWVEFRIHPTHGRLGYLPTFTKHQRVDKPKPSRLKEYWKVAVDDVSTTNPGRVDDSSQPDQVSGIRDQVVDLAPKKVRRAPAPKQAELVPPPPDPRHAPLVARLTEIFISVRGKKYPFSGRDAKAISSLLALADPEDLEVAWERALRHVGYPSVSSLSELQTNLATFIGKGPGGLKGDWRSQQGDYAKAWGVES